MTDELAATLPRHAVTPLDLSIVIVNWNSQGVLADCLRSLAASGTRCHYEIVISDNASTDGSQQWLRQLAQQQPHIHCVYGETNAGFGVGNNRALPLCRGRHVLFLNADTLVLEPLDALVAAADRLGDRCGALGGRVLNADHTLQMTCRLEYTVPIMLSGFTLAFIGKQSRATRLQELADWDHAVPRDVAMISGCYLLVPQRVLAAVGGFDPHIFLFYEDTDLCYRIRQAGYVVRYEPVATIVHLEGAASRSTGLSPFVLGCSLASARYFTATYLGRNQERRLTTAVRLIWSAMWCVLAPLGAVMPVPRYRKKLLQRARLLRQTLAEMPIRHIPLT